MTRPTAKPSGLPTPTLPSLAASLEVWTLYTGLVSYLLIGTLFAIEFVYRHWRFRRYLGAPTDALLRRIFPPRPLVPR